jgi:heptosyltransferase-2
MSRYHRLNTQTPKILILRGGALGDFILTIPAISALRQHWPEAHIELAGHERSACLALASGLIDRLQALDSARMALYFQSEDPLPAEEKKYIASFDLIVSYLHDPDNILRQHLEKAGAKNVIAVSPVSIKGHAADYFYNSLHNVIGDEFKQTVAQKPWAHFIKCAHEHDGASLEKERFVLEWPQALKEEARCQLLKRLGNKPAIIIHPGSGSPAKNWPVKKFAILAKKIRAETLFEPLIIGGEADPKEIAFLRSLLPEFNILENLPLLNIASILSVAAGFIGNDSGLTHLAAALGIPVVALFGPTDPATWGPRGKNVVIIKSRFPSRESLAKIGVEDVFYALKKKLTMLF